MNLDIIFSILLVAFLIWFYFRVTKEKRKQRNKAVDKILEEHPETFREKVQWEMEQIK